MSQENIIETEEVKQKLSAAVVKIEENYKALNDCYRHLVDFSDQGKLMPYSVMQPLHKRATDILKSLRAAHTIE